MVQFMCNYICMFHYFVVLYNYHYYDWKLYYYCYYTCLKGCQVIVKSNRFEKYIFKLKTEPMPMCTCPCFHNKLKRLEYLRWHLMCLVDWMYLLGILNSYYLFICLYKYSSIENMLYGHTLRNYRQPRKMSSYTWDEKLVENKRGTHAYKEDHNLFQILVKVGRISFSILLVFKEAMYIWIGNKVWTGLPRIKKLLTTTWYWPRLKSGDYLHVYLSMTKQAMSLVIIWEDKWDHRPVYFFSKIL